MANVTSSASHSSRMMLNQMQMRVSSHFAKLPACEPLCVIAPRGSGKTTLLCALAINLAKSGKRVTIIVSGKRLKGKAMDIIEKLCGNVGYCGVIDVKSDRESTTLDNFDVVLVDEAAHIDSMFITDTIAPLMISKPFTTLVMIGSPKSGPNLFNKFCRANGPINHVINAMAPMANL
jgi:ABC-type cobalamin/Fe3+-siderophores transport system ATPase subunit